ncbi:MAG: hypothetical protein NVS1B3_10570 [Candidatus Dormibacteraceae bacterium]
MSRNRIAVVIGVLIVFVIVLGAAIYTTRGGGGKNVTLDVTITGAKTMSPSDLSAHQNDTVTINVKSDTDGEVHLHGYDISISAKKGQTVSQTFKADRTGNFPIEWESTSTELGKLTVT